MRIVAGTVGGRRIQGPADKARPTMDKVRGAILNSVSSRFEIVDAAVVDLFAGSGALGIEALSRGAMAATFVERSRTNVGIIRSNLRDLGLTGDVIAQDVLRFLERDHSFDIAFIDPPYAFDDWEALLSRLNARFAVCESDREIPAEGNWAKVHDKQYGGTHVTLIKRSDQIDA